MIKKFEEFVKINEAIVKPVSSNAPATKEELEDIIIQRIEEEGPECDLNDIDVSNITDMSNLFDAYKSDIFRDFNGDISGWDVSNVENMRGMFKGCGKFNGDISGWDVSSVENMAYMLAECKNFNQDIGRWDVSNVEDMSYMFYRCKEFNQDLSMWNVSNVEDMFYMFGDCHNFNLAERLDVWHIDDGMMYTKNMFKGCPSAPSWYKGKI